jgi:glycosyltransferase involved in cell wall biosynthesis
MRISVIIPTYNYAQWLPGAIQSVLSQGIDDIEVLVIDDGSTDETPDVGRTYEAKDARVRYMRQERDGYGCIRAINLGIRQARGGYFCWLSSDDRFLPGKLATQLEIGADFSFTDFVVALAPGVSPSVFKHIRVAPDATRDAEGYLTWVRRVTPGNLLDANHVNGCTVMIRMDVLRSMGPFDESLRHTADYEMWLRMEAAGVRFVHIPEPLTWTRIHATNTSVWPRMEQEADRVRQRWSASKTSSTSAQRMPND